MTKISWLGSFIYLPSFPPKYVKPKVKKSKKYYSTN